VEPDVIVMPAATPAPASPARIAAAVSGRQRLRHGCRPADRPAGRGARSAGRPALGASGGVGIPVGISGGIPFSAPVGAPIGRRAAVTASGALTVGPTWNVRVTGSGSQPVAG
jgi:hypothetical protein